nr:hypothetical protein HK105_002517 [Polyrhizophydium stewartii]
MLPPPPPQPAAPHQPLSQSPQQQQLSSPPHTQQQAPASPPGAAHPTIDSEPDSTKGDADPIASATAELDEAARKLAKLEELIDKTFSIEARNDQKCPICRAKRISYVEDRELQKRTEQEHDRMLLHLSLDLDKDFIQKKRENEAAKLKNAISTAHYNHLKALEKQQSHSKKESLPMGNLFENREVKRDPVLMQQALASGLKQQVRESVAPLRTQAASSALTLAHQARVQTHAPFAGAIPKVDGGSPQ